MDMYSIDGGRPLRGAVQVSGSKNACLPIMCAALLADGPTVLENVPDLRDIRSMVTLLEHLNARVEFRNHVLVIDSRGFDTGWVPYDIMRKMRASMYAFGPTIARLGRAAVSQPGGCNIGARPIDLHLKGFRALGVEIETRSGYIHARHGGLKGCEMNLQGASGPSVGATCNVLMAAALAHGRTVIRGAAREPEVQELARFLNSMGAQIENYETGAIIVEGVEHLRPTRWRIAPDRIEAGTFAIAAAITGGDILVQNVDPPSMTATLWALRRWGANIEHLTEDSFRVTRGDATPQPLDVITEPYPGLATDIQPAFAALMGLTPGVSTITETIYPDRFMYLDELNRLGAVTRRDGATACIVGVNGYCGAPVMASDLRAGAALSLAALAAEGTSEVRRIYHVERGYERFELKLAALGASIRRSPEEEPARPQVFSPGLEEAEAFSAALEEAEEEAGR